MFVNFFAASRIDCADADVVDVQAVKSLDVTGRQNMTDG